MSLNSVNTNISAQVALQSLNATNSNLQATQKRISTGYRVADATDDGAAFAVAQKVRADTGALTTVNQQLGNAKGLVGTALAGLTSISNSLSSANSLLVKLGDQGISSDARAQYVTQFKALVQQVASTVDSSTYNGKTLLGKTGAAAVTDGTANANVISSETGTQLSVSAEDNGALAQNLYSLIGGTSTTDAATGKVTFNDITGTDLDAVQGKAVAALTGKITTGTTTANYNPTSGYTTPATNIVPDATVTGITSLQAKVATQLNQASADSNSLDATITFNSSKIDSLNAGLGALIDADLSKESANLQALQIRQQLGTQALSLANQSPQSLLSLFK